MTWGCNQLIMAESLRQALGNENAFETVMRLQGNVYRDVPGRRTMRVEIAGKSYFVKQHFGVGWGEIFKNLLTLRRPVVSALTEWLAIERLEQLGIPTTPAVAYGCKGRTPATLHSFILTRDLGDITSLEDVCRDWLAHPPAPHIKRLLLKAVAHIARTIHDNGLIHRDFYLCHLCPDLPKLAAGEAYIYLVDLHRVEMYVKAPPNARMKDIAALYFSALDSGLTRRDCLRFLRQYRGMPLHEIFRTERPFWKAVDRRARKLYYKFHQHQPVTPFDKPA